MLKKIESLRKESKETRNRYAFWFAFLFTAVVTVFWLTTVPARLAVLSGGGAAEAEKAESSLSRMFNSMKANVLEGVPVSEETQGEVLEEDINTIDFETFFSTSSTERDLKPEGKPVLIATTSAAAPKLPVQ